MLAEWVHCLFFIGRMEWHCLFFVSSILEELALPLVLLEEIALPLVLLPSSLSLFPREQIQSTQTEGVESLRITRVPKFSRPGWPDESVKCDRGLPPVGLHRHLHCDSYCDAIDQAVQRLTAARTFGCVWR